MEITPRELRDIEIHSEIRGYSRDEVNDLLERAAASIEASNERVTQLQDRLTSAQSEAVRTRETEDILHRTLLLAQRAADEAVAEATAKSRQMLDEAEMRSRRLVADVRGRGAPHGRGRTPPARTRDRRARRTARHAARRRRGVDALRGRVPRAHGARARDRPLRAADPRHDGARGQARDERRRASAEAIAPAPGGRDARTPPRRRTTIVAEAAVARGHASRRSPTPNRRARSRAGRHRRARRAKSTCARCSSSAGARAPSEPVVEPPVRPRGFQPIDLAAPDGVDADILDDDAFFATLRDAVHDEKPLGPRDEGDDITGENRFFDQDADRGSFRDVFRRRR